MHCSHSHVALHVQGQLVGVALSFLRNFGILSGASGVLGALSSGVASAALDDRFAVQRAQQKQVSRTIPPDLPLLCFNQSLSCPMPICYWQLCTYISINIHLDIVAHCLLGM